MYRLSDFQIWKIVFLFYWSFLIRDGRTVGLNYGRPYVSQVLFFNPILWVCCSCTSDELVWALRPSIKTHRKRAGGTQSPNQCFVCSLRLHYRVQTQTYSKSKKKTQTYSTFHISYHAIAIMRNMTRYHNTTNDCCQRYSFQNFSLVMKIRVWIRNK